MKEQRVHAEREREREMEGKMKIIEKGENEQQEEPQFDSDRYLFCVGTCQLALHHDICVCVCVCVAGWLYVVFFSCRVMM